MFRSKLLGLHDKWVIERNSQFLGLLERNPQARAIDLGCGDGDFTIRVWEKIGCPLIYGADIWEEGLAEARKKQVETRKVDLDGEISFPSGEFDVVASNQVLEHLAYPCRFLGEVKRILKPGGYAVISTENLSSWDNVGALVVGYTPFSMQFDGGKVGNPLSPLNKEELRGYPPHTRIFTYKGLVEALQDAGFTVEACLGQGYVPFNALARIDPRHARFLTVKARKTK
jgi:SAM-dependent methyltransferase